jgi:Flp pilus assembly protein TadB
MSSKGDPFSTVWFFLMVLMVVVFGLLGHPPWYIRLLVASVFVVGGFALLIYVNNRREKRH